MKVEDLWSKLIKIEDFGLLIGCSSKIHRNATWKLAANIRKVQEWPANIEMQANDLFYRKCNPNESEDLRLMANVGVDWKISFEVDV